MIRRVADWILATVRSIPVFGAAVAVSGLAILLAIASAVINLDHVSDLLATPGGATPTVAKEVGYLWSINWSLNYIIVAPLAVALLITSLNAGRVGLNGMTERGMIRDSTWSNIYLNRPVPLWRSYERVSTIVALLIAVGLIVLFAKRWWVTSGGPLLNGNAVADSDLDWANAAMRHEVVGGKWANAAFSLVASCLQAGYVLSGFWMLFIAVGGASTLLLMSTSPSLRIVPDLRSADERRGFEEFESFAELFLGTTLCMLVSLWLIVVHGAYLHSSAPNVFAFITSTEGFHVATPSGFPEQAALCSAIVLVAGALASPVLALYAAARTSAKRIRRALDTGEVDAGRLWGISKEIAVERLNGMVFWPSKYYSARRLILAITLALGSFLWAPIVVGLIAHLIYIVLVSVSKKAEKVIIDAV